MTIEQRLTTRLIAYWERIKQEGSPVPNIESFNPQMIDDLWSRCFQVSVTQSDQKNHYTYDYVGSSITEIFGTNLVGNRVTSKMHFMPARKMIEQMDSAMIAPETKLLDGQFVDENNKLIKYRSCLLPFGHDKQSITHFIIGISWNSFG